MMVIQNEALVAINFHISEDSRDALEKVLRITPRLEAENVVTQQTSVNLLGHVRRQGGLPIAHFWPGNVNELLEDQRVLAGALAGDGGHQVIAGGLQSYHSTVLPAVKS